MCGDAQRSVRPGRRTTACGCRDHAGKETEVAPAARRILPLANRPGVPVVSDAPHVFGGLGRLPPETLVALHCEDRGSEWPAKAAVPPRVFLSRRRGCPSRDAEGNLTNSKTLRLSGADAPLSERQIAPPENRALVI